VERDDLVLEIGSGGSPYYRSNILCDAYLETGERFYEPLVRDRPTAIGLGEALPFKDNSFDFVIASHVLEHSAQPEKFLSEIQRVGKAGYIEVPDAFMEGLTHYGFHRLEISELDGVLHIRKKRDYIEDEDVVSLFSRKVKPIFPNLVGRYPFHFHVRYYWSREKGGISYKIANPDFIADWVAPEIKRQGCDVLPFMWRVKSLLSKTARFLFSQRVRNKKIRILDYLRCPICTAENLTFIKSGSIAICQRCNHEVQVFVNSST